MKLFFLCLLYVACLCAADENNKDFIENVANVEYNGKYFYHYKLFDGSHVTQNGEQKNFGNDRFGESIEGQYSFVGDDGQDYSVSYTADERGFRPVGDHLPTPPPTPESVLKTLKYLAEHPQVPSEQ